MKLTSNLLQVYIQTSYFESKNNIISIAWISLTIVFYILENKDLVSL